MSEYYNVRLHKFIWINETALNQMEEVKPEVTVMDFGIDCTGCSSLISNKLKVVKHVWDMTRPSMNVVPVIKNKLSFQLLHYFYNDISHLPLLYLLKLM